MKTLNEYFLQGEKISFINEYLLSKENPKPSYIDEYYVVFTHGPAFKFFIKKYGFSKKEIQTKNDVTLFILSKDEINEYEGDKSTIFLYDIPDKYENFKDVKNFFSQRNFESSLFKNIKEI